MGARKSFPLLIRLRNKIGKIIHPRYTEYDGRNRVTYTDQEPITPHILRRTCAFMLRQAGVDIETRAKMLGHSIETASKYGAPRENEIEKASSLLDHADAA